MCIFHICESFLLPLLQNLCRDVKRHEIQLPAAASVLMFLSSTCSFIATTTQIYKANSTDLSGGVGNVIAELRGDER